MISIDKLHEQEVISHLDYYFAIHSAHVFSHDDPLVLAACALVSKSLTEGHICLYLSKYHDFQCRLVQALAERICAKTEPKDLDFIRSALDGWFLDQNPDHVCHQKQAVTKALHHNFTVISGGPGTGKTHITRIIRQIIQARAKAGGLPSPRFLSLAPTGRAASRLQDGATIHSVLIPRKNRPGFVHGKDNRLAADVVIIDEASMIDMALMTRLLEAIPPAARVILLGDDNQLSPVQAGDVFSDICKAEVLQPFVVSLTYNFRSRGKTGIENLANAIRKNDVNDVTRILTKARYPDIAFEQPGPGYLKTLETLIQKGYAPFMQQQDMTGSLDALDRFRILCAHNIGEYGTLQINHLCEKVLRTVFDSGIRGRLCKQMIMISSNDYARGLFNGDTGVVLSHKDSMVAGFKMENGMVRKFGYLDLPPHEPAFGVTIHKSQGSEFETVLILIPDRLSRVVTRQLLYTGVTRARKKVIILGSLSVIKEAMALSMEKKSFLPGLLAREIKRCCP
jgi:exodeoxyribonuclease V alpha subunit